MTKRMSAWKWVARAMCLLIMGCGDAAGGDRETDAEVDAPVADASVADAGSDGAYVPAPDPTSILVRVTRKRLDRAEVAAGVPLLVSDANGTTLLVTATNLAGVALVEIPGGASLTVPTFESSSRKELETFYGLRPGQTIDVVLDSRGTEAAWFATARVTSVPAGTTDVAMTIGDCYESTQRYAALTMQLARRCIDPTGHVSGMLLATGGTGTLLGVATFSSVAITGENTEIPFSAFVPPTELSAFTFQGFVAQNSRIAFSRSYFEVHGGRRSVLGYPVHWVNGAGHARGNSGAVATWINAFPYDTQRIAFIGELTSGRRVEYALALDAPFAPLTLDLSRAAAAGGLIEPFADATSDATDLARPTIAWTDSPDTASADAVVVEARWNVSTHSVRFTAFAPPTTASIRVPAFTGEDFGWLTPTHTFRTEHVSLVDVAGRDGYAAFVARDAHDLASSEGTAPVAGAGARRAGRIVPRDVTR